MSTSELPKSEGQSEKITYRDFDKISKFLLCVIFITVSMGSTIAAKNFFVGIAFGVAVVAVLLFIEQIVVRLLKSLHEMWAQSRQ